MSVDRPRAVLAEDQVILRMEAADMLADLGFDVLEACHADEALKHMETAEGVVLLFTDVEMPGCARDGFGLAQEVARRWPSMSIIICSGCTPPAPDTIPDGARFISKPCMQHLVQQALNTLHSLN